MPAPTLRGTLPHTPPHNARPQHAIHGFTLIELLVAISLMAIMAAMSWRGIDGMFTAQNITRERSNSVQVLQTALSQWGMDLDAMQTIAHTTPLDWDGQVLRITRRSSTVPDQGPVVVAWTRRPDPNQPGGGLWLRWQSAPLQGQDQWQQAWQQAVQWARTASAASQRGEVALMPLQNWSIFYHRGGTWSNPLSSSGGGNGALPGFPGNTPASAQDIPDGIRLQITLPAGQALEGAITRDWVNPTLTASQR